MSIATILLAAGKGTRMNSDVPKVLHPLAGAPMLHHAMRTAAAIDPAHMVVVGGHGLAAVRKAALAFDSAAQVVEQTEQLGTGHAARMAQPALEGFAGTVLVMFGDTPFVRPETLEALAAAAQDAEVVVLGFEAADPGRYGRLVVEDGHLARIVEFKDATNEERAITLCNSGVLACRSPLIWELLDEVADDNAAGEFYLTDLPALARKRDLSVTVVTCDEAETLGINSRAELAAADALFQSKAKDAMIADGVTLLDPGSTYLAFDTVIGRDAIIDPNVYFGPGVTVESGAHIRAFSHLEGCHVARGAIIGPFARLRPGAELSEDTRVGNFVEIKNAQIYEGAKVNHLSYIGDATIGPAANIGAGTVTCNYDGFAKHHTEIGACAFIGSDTMLVAPVRIGAGAMTVTGSVITEDVPDDAVAFARARQETKPGRAPKLFEMLKARAAKMRAAVAKG
ncbi:MAG: bifunctional UDP-N-acetylglucosamine diphosphorylase/glucosamine-1-phosphate N-acetyltransferase GlmU [Pseudomonadota bacterium]